MNFRGKSQAGATARVAAWAILLAAMAGTGCGGRRGVEPGELEGVIPEYKVIVLWQAGTAANLLQSVANSYTNAPGVRIHVAQVPRAAFDEQLRVHFDRPVTQFDVVLLKTQWIAEFSERKLVLDLSSFLKRETDLVTVNARIREVLCEYPIASGNYYAAPCYPEPLGMVYRADWFADERLKSGFRAKTGQDLAVPRTWPALLETATFFQDPASGRYGLAVPTDRDADGGLSQTFHMVFRALGGQYTDAVKGMWTGQINQETTLRSVSLIRDLSLVGPPGASDMSEDGVIRSFIEGKTAVAICHFSAFEGIRAVLGDKAAYAPVPGGMDGKPAVYVEGYSMAVSARLPPERVERAMAFLKWFLTPEVQAKWTAAGGPPFRQANLADPAFIGIRPWNDAYRQSIDGFQRFGETPASSVLMQLVRKHVGDAMDGFVDPQKALDLLATEADDYLRAENILKYY